MATRAPRSVWIPAFLLSLLLVGCAPSWIGDAAVRGSPAPGPRAADATPVASPVPLSEPPKAVLLPSEAPDATADFLGAYALGDEAAGDQVASPLYRFEWARRGLSVEARARLAMPIAGSADPSQRKMSFSYIGGAFDDLGFGHLLFSAQSALPDRSGTPSVFRIDVDPSGRVIWIEMVWHFGSDTEAARPVTDAGELAALPSPTTTCCARPLFGVASTDVREGYYAYAYQPADSARSDPSQRPAPIRIRFYAVDSDGRVRAGVWTYDLDEALSPGFSGRKPVRKVPQVGAEDAPLWRAYLSTLD